VQCLTVMEKLRSSAVQFARDKLFKKKDTLVQVIAELDWVSSMTDEERESEIESLESQDIAPTPAKTLITSH
jgi:hypothetical protein